MKSRRPTSCVSRDVGRGIWTVGGVKTEKVRPSDPLKGKERLGHKEVDVLLPL